MPINDQPIRPTSSMTSGAGLSNVVNLLVERSNNAVKLINKNEAGIGDLSKLNSDDKSSLVNAMNELTARLENGDLIADYVGLLRDLNTSNKTNIVAAINEVNNNVGPLSLLEVDDVTNVVAALNYLNEVVGQLGNIGDGDFDNIIDAINSKVARIGDTMTGALKMASGSVNAQIFVGLDNTASKTGNSLEIKTNKGVGFGPLLSGGPIPIGNFAQFFDVTNGDATFVGNLTVEKTIEASGSVFLRGQKLAWRNPTSGAELANIIGTNAGALTITTTGTNAGSFNFEGKNLLLPADPTSGSHATNKTYVDTKDAEGKTYADNTFFKKTTGGNINGNTDVSGHFKASQTITGGGSVIVKQPIANAVVTLKFEGLLNNVELGAMYYDPGSNTVKVRVNEMNSQAKFFTFGNDGNFDLGNQTPTSLTHATSKKFVDDQIAWVRQRSNQLGTQKLETIEDAGLLAGKDKVTVGDIQAAGTANSTSALFGDGQWRTIALNADNFISKVATASQTMASALVSPGTITAAQIVSEGTSASRWVQVALTKAGVPKGTIFVDTIGGTNQNENKLGIRAHHFDSAQPYKEIILNGNTGTTDFPGAISASTITGSAVMISSGAQQKFRGISPAGVDAWITLLANNGASSYAEIGQRSNGHAYIWVNGQQFTFDNNGGLTIPKSVSSGQDIYAAANVWSRGGQFKRWESERSAFRIVAPGESWIDFSDDNSVVFEGSGARMIGLNGAGWKFTLGADSGDAWFAGNISGFSDARTKTNITKLEGALDKVNRLRGVSFKKKFGNTNIQYGFIAQEVLEVVPDLVTESSNPEELKNIPGAKSLYSIDHGNGFSALIVEAIKELSAKVDRLEKENEELRKKVK